MADRTALARFLAKVDKRGPLPPLRPDLGRCWRWTGTVNRKGYGTWRCAKRRMGAHRWAHELFIGPIPHGLIIDHLCRNPSCVRPSHLEPVTYAENVERGRKKSDVTHCPHGHPYAGHNLIIRNGWRFCRACKNADARRRYHRSKECARV